MPDLHKVPRPQVHLLIDPPISHEDIALIAYAFTGALGVLVGHWIASLIHI